MIVTITFLQYVVNIGKNVYSKYDMWTYAMKRLLGFLPVIQWESYSLCVISGFSVLRTCKLSENCNLVCPAFVSQCTKLILPHIKEGFIKGYNQHNRLLLHNSVNFRLDHLINQIYSICNKNCHFAWAKINIAILFTLTQF